MEGCPEGRVGWEEGCVLGSNVGRDEGCCVGNAVVIG